MQLEYDTMVALMGFALKCDCGFTVNSGWNLCPNCGKPIVKPKFGKCSGSIVYVRPSEVAHIVARMMFVNPRKEVSQ